jgi:transcriptional regulator with XRE-family HTH domain
MAQGSSLHCDIRASFATAFRNWRLKETIPLKQVATDPGVSIATVNTWESGKCFPAGRHFEMVADFCGGD